MNTATTNLSAQNVRKTTLWMSLLSILPHIFCCGIPAIAAMISLGTTVGLGAVLATNPLYSFVDQYHSILLMVAVAGVTFSGILNFIAYRIDCREAACSHGNCKPKKRRSFRIFMLSLFLLMLDLAWFATEEYVLGLHHHGHDAHHEGHAHHHDH